MCFPIILIVFICQIIFKVKKIPKLDKEDREEIIWMVTGVTVASYVLIVLLALFLSLANYTKIDTEVKDEIVYEIKALRDKSDISSIFFLGTGATGNKLIYYVMAKKDEGVILKELNPKNTIIVEEENCKQPRYVRREHYNIYKKNDNIFWWFLKPFSNWYDEISTAHTKDEYILYIPAGSILNDFIIDLE